MTLKKLLNVSLIFILSISMSPTIALSQNAEEKENVVSQESGDEYNAGLEFFKKRQYTEAIPHFRKAYELDERNVAALFAHALTLNNIKQYKEAAERLELLLSKDPAHDKALLLYGLIRLAPGISQVLKGDMRIDLSTETMFLQVGDEYISS